MDMGVTYENADFDALLIAANKETDPAKRADILVKAEAMFSDNAPCIPLLHWKGSVAISPEGEGRRVLDVPRGDQLPLRRHRGVV